MTLKEIKTVVDGALAKKVIQYQFKQAATPWQDYKFDGSMSPMNFNQYDYRIKPEPREFWVNEYLKSLGEMHSTFDKAKEAARLDSSLLIRTIHLREVLDEKEN